MQLFVYTLRYDYGCGIATVHSDYASVLIKVAQHGSACVCFSESDCNRSVRYLSGVF